MGKWPGLDAVAANQSAWVSGSEPVSEAGYFLELYKSFMDEPNLEEAVHDALDALASLESTNWAFGEGEKRRRLLVGR